MENIFVKFARMLMNSQFEKILNKIQKEIQDDPEIQAKITNIKNDKEELTKDLEHFCDRQPWHYLCKDRQNNSK